MKMTQQQCADSITGMAKFFWFCIKLCFYSSGLMGLFVGISLLTQGRNKTGAYLAIIYGAAVIILFLVNMIRKQRFLLLLILAVMAVPGGTVVQVLVAAAVIAVVALLYRGVVAKEKKKPAASLNGFDRFIKTVAERYIYMLLDVYFIRRWLLTKPHFADLWYKKCGIR